LTAKNSGQRASKLLNVKSEVCALDFDLACTLRLLKFESEQMETNAKLIAYEVGKLFGGSDGEQEVDGGAEEW
jgi:hypothetical protein